MNEDPLLKPGPQRNGRINTDLAQGVGIALPLLQDAQPRGSQIRPLAPGLADVQADLRVRDAQALGRGGAVGGIDEGRGRARAVVAVAVAARPRRRLVAAAARREQPRPAVQPREALHRVHHRRDGAHGRVGAVGVAGAVARVVARAAGAAAEREPLLRGGGGGVVGRAHGVGPARRLGPSALQRQVRRVVELGLPHQVVERVALVGAAAAEHHRARRHAELRVRRCWAADRHVEAGAAPRHHVRRQFERHERSQRRRAAR